MASGEGAGESGGTRGLGAALLGAGTRLVVRAAEKVLSDPRGQEALARAVGLAQRGKKQLQVAQEQLLAAAGIPGRQDYQDLAKRLARIKRKARTLAVKLEPEARRGGAGGRREDAGGEGGGPPDDGA